jgi:hypothetical protein
MIRLEEVTSWSKKCMILDRGENMNKNAAQNGPGENNISMK